jgi:regulatory protein
VVERVVSRCRELGYVDDEEYAVAHVRDRIRLKPRGRFRLRMELRKKGISDRDAEAAIDRAFREEEVTEHDLLERAARKRWESRRSDDPETVRRRLYGYLRRRGFRGAEIRDVVDDLMQDR